MQSTLKFVPILTSKAGCCLTHANWQELGIAAGAFYLDDLLMKPGRQHLQTIKSLADYWGWPGQTILNASLLMAKAEMYSLTSCFDGSRIVIQPSELVALVKQLQPDCLILPADWRHTQPTAPWQNLADHMQLFAPINASNGESLERDEAIGCYLVYDASYPFDLFIQQLALCKSNSLYVAGMFNQAQLSLLQANGVSYVESGSPAQDAILGLVYNENTVLDLRDACFAQQHQVIGANCDCPTCKLNLTRAYLHHLLAQTPLLAKRFLIQHNVKAFA